MLNSLLIQLSLLSFVLLTLSSHPGCNSINHKELKKEKSLAWLSDCINSIPWLFRSILYLIYLTINTVVHTFTQIIATFINLLQQSIKLIELVGYCVRLVLQANYNLVSSCATRIRRFVQNCYVLFKDLVESTLKTAISLISTTLTFLHNLVFNMPKLYEVTGIGLETTAKMAGSFAHKTNSTFRTFLSMIGAVVELFGRSIVNTLKLGFDLLSHALLSIAHVFQLIGKTIISFVIKVCESGMVLLERIWTGVKFVSSIIIKYTKNVFHGGMWFVKAFFTTMCDIFLSVFQSIGLFVRYCGSLICNSFAGLGRIINSAARSIAKIGAQLISSIKASKLSVVSISSMVLIASSLWLVFKINIFMLGFSFLETSIQRVAMWMIRVLHREQPTIKIDRTHATNTINSACSSASSVGSEESLRRQLELERDKTLCVVCQDQLKKILLLPCRHMCICVMCANHLTRFTQWNRGVCPLCRTPIGSMVEVYS